jgi:Fe-S cluster assembly ATP-binding protein
MLKITNYSVYSADTNKQLVEDINLEVKKNEVHLVFGKNGAGKSSLIQSLMGLSQYTTKGKTKIKDMEIQKLTTDQRAKERLFLAYQNPIEIPGLKNIDYLRLAYNKLQKDEDILDPWSFADLLEVFVTKLELPHDTPQRGLNEGFSGGERRKFEILQMLLLEPEYLLLDEVDSGLDADAQEQIFEYINSYIKEFKPAVILISHNVKILDYIKPTHVHLMKEGKIIKSGDIELAKQIIEEGYASTN